MWSTKAKVLVFLTILLFLIAWNTGLDSIYLLVAINFSFLIVSLFLAQISTGGVRCYRVMKNTAFEDDHLNVKLSVKNRSIFPKYYLKVTDFFSAGFPEQRQQSSLIVFLKQRGRFDWFYSVRCYKRGLYNIGPCWMVGSDPLGLFFKRKRLGMDSPLLVYPKMFNISYLPLALKGGAAPWFGIETARISGEDSEFFGVREYRRGDALNRIHWRSSARLNQLMVKEYERAAICKVTVALDLKRDHDIGVGRETTLEYGIKIAASIVRYLARMGALVQLTTSNLKPTVIPFGKGEWHLSRVLRLLATIQADGILPLGLVLEEMGSVIPADSTLVTVTLDTDHQTLASLMHLKVRGVSLLPFILVSSTFEQLPKEGPGEKMRRRRSGQTGILPGLGAEAYYICQGDDLNRRFEEMLR